MVLRTFMFPYWVFQIEWRELIEDRFESLVYLLKVFKARVCTCMRARDMWRLISHCWANVFLRLVMNTKLVKLAVDNKLPYIWLIYNCITITPNLQFIVYRIVHRQNRELLVHGCVLPKQSLVLSGKISLCLDGPPPGDIQYFIAYSHKLRV